MQALLAKALIHLLALLPFRVSYMLGTMMGFLAYIIPNSLHKPAKINIDLCFPELSEQQRAKIYRDSFIELGRVAAETGALLLWNKSRILNLVKKVSGRELFDESLTKNQGVIIAAPHLGAWEMIGLYCSTQFQITSLYRPLRMEKLDPLVKKAREKFGATLVPTNAAGVRALYKALENNQLAGILPDQDPGNEGSVFAPFFGIQTSTMTLLPRLAKKSGATVLFGYAERLPRGAGYHIRFLPASAPIHKQDNHAQAAALINKGVEDCIRLSPAQYQWSYKRFKTRPDGETGFY